ncbi:translation initiation factor SU [Ustulina deusta]|nr:translation initiation factor SU [Ustulina deusta]
MSIENLKSFDPFHDAEVDEDTSQVKKRNGRKTLTTVQGLPNKFDRKKILTVVKKQFACNGTVVMDSKMGEVIQLQGDQRKVMLDFLTDPKGLELDAKKIKVHGF